MDAFHSFWSKPNCFRNEGKIRISDYELLTMMLSALKWKEVNGSIKMITDSAGAEYLKGNGLDGLWDEMDTGLDRVDTGIDPVLFWAAGKLYALKSMACPCVMLDTDLIIWKDISDKLSCDVVAAHSEELEPSVYPDVGCFSMKEGYQFPPGWDYNVKAANTAFLYIKDSRFRDYYVDCAEQFMGNVAGEDFTPITAMCFAEQRVLPMCAGEKGLQMGYLLELKSAGRQDFVTHVWGHKRVLENSYADRKEFCIRCIKRIVREFPEYEGVVAQNPSLVEYYQSC